MGYTYNALKVQKNKQQPLFEKNQEDFTEELCLKARVYTRLRKSHTGPYELPSVKIYLFWDFPVGPLIKNPHCNTRGELFILGTNIPHTSWSKNQNIKQSNIVTNSIKTLKNCSY